MLKEFLMIHKDVLPPCYEQVVKAGKLIGQEGKSVSDVCKELDISRSTFYKYKDYVFLTSGLNSKKANLLVKMKEKGSFVELLTFLEELNIKTLNIHKEALVNGVQEIFLTVSTDNITADFNDVVKDMRRVNCVKEVLLLASE